MVITSKPTLSTSAPPPPQEKKNLLGEMKDAVLDSVVATTDFLERNPVTNATIYKGLAVSRIINAFPNFIYPTITGATPAEKAFILDVLDTLPLKDVNSVKGLSVVPDIEGASGLAFRHTVTNTIQLNREQISIRPSWFKEVLIHEVGHTKDYQSSWFNHAGLGNHSDHAPWGQGPYVTEYSGKSHWEDYAESYAKYHVEPEELKKANPQKFAEIEKHQKLGLTDRLIDRKEFRETGKWIGEHIAPSQGVRTALQVGFWATGALQLVHGLGQMHRATETDDPKMHMAGVLNVAAGTLFATQLMSGAGLAIQGANRALHKAIDRGEITARDGDAMVRTFSDPVEKGVRFLGQAIGLSAPFEPLVPKAPKQQQDAEAPKRARAAAIATGGAVGGLAGGILGPYAGVMAGYNLAGPVGGAVGLIVGGVVGYAGGASLGGRAGGALARAFGA